jgi:hypothetical protein
LIALTWTWRRTAFAGAAKRPWLPRRRGRAGSRHGLLGLDVVAHEGQHRLGRDRGNGQPRLRGRGGNDVEREQQSGVDLGKRPLQAEAGGEDGGPDDGKRVLAPAIEDGPDDNRMLLLPSRSTQTTNCSRSRRDRRHTKFLTLYAWGEAALLRRLHLDHFRHVVLEQVLDAHLERGRRAGAARAGPLHVQVDHAIPEILEDDIAAVLGHRRPDAGFEQFLDLGDDLVVLGRGLAGAWESEATTGSPEV